ncbi:MAG: 2-oxo acid dehydrogenase subunit E2 [Desulfobacterales bacterium]|nr:2-oxo acid dehydrogenase subunit E2 [Desulfobacterales bacterium]
MINDRDEIQVEEVMDVTFTLDHRITGGFNFSQAILTVKEMIYNPDQLLKKPEKPSGSVRNGLKRTFGNSVSPFRPSPNGSSSSPSIPNRTSVS